MDASDRTLSAVIAVFAAKALCIAALGLNMVIGIVLTVDGGYINGGLGVLTGMCAGAIATAIEAGLVYVIISAFMSALDRSELGSGLPRRYLRHPNTCMHDLTGRPAGTAWHALRVAAALMPPAVGQRWLAEAASCLHETAPQLREVATRNYLATAPLVLTITWTDVLARSRVAIAGRTVAGQRHGAKS